MTGPADSHDCVMLCNLCNMHVLNCRMLVPTNAFAPYAHIPERASLVSMDPGSSPILSATDNRQPQGTAAQMHSGDHLGGANSPAHVM